MIVPVIHEGTEAPGFELPGLIDGARRPIALDEFLGQDVVILAFYPADFNPACGTESDLDELDLFTMQKDVEVLAVGPDTLYSHAAFADEYDLRVPLLSDTDHEVAERYGVDFVDDVGQRLVERAVFVVDHDGLIQYAWSTRDMTELPESDEIKDAIADTGGDDTALARYRVGYAHYTEARRAFTSAMHSYRDSEWMLAQSDFKRAREEFEEAAEHYDSAARFADDEVFGLYYERTQEKATSLWQAADWLSQSASAYSSGSGAEGQQLRDDAERPLENARDIGEPVDPDDWPPEDDGDERGSILPQDEKRAAALAVDIDDEMAEAATDEDAAGDEAVGSDADGGDDRSSEGADSADDEDAIDDAELEEIEAELAASQPDDPEGEELEENPTSLVDAPPSIDESATDAAGERDSVDETPSSTREASTDGDENSDVDEAELEALEAELAANRPVDDGVVPERRADDDGESAGRRDDPPANGEGQPSDDDPSDHEDSSGTDDPSAAESREPPADPHADLASGSDQLPPGASRSLEPTGASDDASDDGDGEQGLDDEPQGASDEDLAGIPTTEDLEAEDEEGDDEEGDETEGDEEDIPDDSTPADEERTE